MSLDLSWCRRLTDEALGMIVDSCLSLKLLKLFGCTQVYPLPTQFHFKPFISPVCRCYCNLLVLGSYAPNLFFIYSFAHFFMCACMWSCVLLCVCEGEGEGELCVNLLFCQNMWLTENLAVIWNNFGFSNVWPIMCWCLPQIVLSMLSSFTCYLSG